MQEFLREMKGAGLYVGEPGKGRACWLALGYLLAEESVEYVAFQDADVVNFRREMLARLVLPAIDPTVDFDFVKAYYARVSDRLHGRVTRLLLTPLLAAFTRLLGDDPYIRYLSSFRYALSGEFVVKSDLAERMRLPCDWGLEIVTLFEALRHRAPVRVCQVELADRYDHKHQDLSAGDPARGLHRMAKDVIKHLLRTLAAAGVNLSDGLLRSLLAAYQREAEDAVADSYAVSIVNGLVFDRHEEEQNVQTFTVALRASIEEFLADPLGAPLVPNWARVWAGMPDAGPRLLAAVQEGAVDGSGKEQPDARRTRGGHRPGRVPARPEDLPLGGGPARARRARSVGASPSSSAAARPARRWSPSTPTSASTRPSSSRTAGASSSPRARPGRAWRAATGGRSSCAWACPSATSRRTLLEIAKEAGARVRAFSRLSPREVKDLTGLPESKRSSGRAARARRAVPPGRGRRARDAGSGGAPRPARHARGPLPPPDGDPDKGRAVRQVLALLAPAASIGLGDAENDLGLLGAVDRPILVPRPDGDIDPALDAAFPAAERAPAAGPAGWNKAVSTAVGD